MKNLTLIVDTMRIPLASSLDVEALKKSIIAAARSGGDFVPLESERGVHYDLLITSASTVMVQSVTNVFEFSSAITPWTEANDLEL